MNLECLNTSYPDLQARIVSSGDGKLWLRPKKGLDILYHNPTRSRSRDEILLNSTVYESMLMPYTPGTSWTVPENGNSPGRARSYGLLKALYGGGREIIEQRLERVDFVGNPVTVAKRVAGPLRAVVAELEVLLQQKPELAEYIAPVFGYSWRLIQASGRLSGHSYGLAVDLNPDKGPYWLWTNKAPHPGPEMYPAEFAEIFEKHGFIWGGKWFHYDFMHFEYRPEIICKANKGGFTLPEQTNMLEAQ